MRSWPVGSEVILCLTEGGGKGDMSRREQGADKPRANRKRGAVEAGTRREQGRDGRVTPVFRGQEFGIPGPVSGFRGRSREDGAGGFISGNCAGKGRESLTVAR